MKTRSQSKWSVNNIFRSLFAAILILTNLLVSAQATTKQTAVQPKIKTDTATFAEGCFWCTEALFEQLNGVISVESGFSGGKTKNPSYTEVCTGNTGHAEACQIVYNPAIISFKDLLEVFWKTHDPTTLNKQGHDEGTQYRSAIFYHTAEQKMLAEKFKKELDAAKAFPKTIVTEITRYTNFYKAENYHQEYFKLNGAEPYCQMVIQPKVDKFQKVFKDKLKK